MKNTKKAQSRQRTDGESINVLTAKAGNYSFHRDNFSLRNRGRSNTRRDLKGAEYDNVL